MESFFSVIPAPLGGSVKNIFSSTILYPPLNNLTKVESVWVDTDVPTTDLVTSTNFKTPVFVIGPTFVVPKPTLLTFTISSSIFNKSLITIDEIPAKDNIVVDIDTWPLTFPDNVVVIGVNVIGDCITLSRVIRVFSFFLNIVNWCLFPDPTELNVIGDPPLVVDNWNIGELVMPEGKTTYTSLGKGLPFDITNDEIPTPSIEDPGL